MRHRSVWILSAIIVVLLAYIGQAEWRARRGAVREVETLGRFDPGQVVELSIAAGGHTMTAVGGADGRWSLTEPTRDEADGPTILSILANLRELRIVRRIEDPDDLAQYGLTHPRTITITERGFPGRTRHTYHLGEISPVHYVCPLDYWIYVQREGETAVLVVEGYQLDHLLPREPADLRNRNLLALDPRAIQKVEVALGEHAYTAVRRADGWRVEGSAAPAPIMYMPQILFTMANLRAVRAEVRGPADLARLQLDRPAARVALYTDRAEPVEVLSFGRVDDATGLVHVRRGSTRFVYLVTRQILDELRRPALASSFSVSRVVAFGSLRLSLRATSWVIPG